MDIESFRKAGYTAVDAICDYYQNMSKSTVRAQVKPGYLIDQLPSEAPVDGEDFSAISADFQRLILPGITHWQHGKFMAYFPGISTFESIIADMYATSVSNPGFNWICSPACTELEQVTMEWMAKVLGLGEHFQIAGGVGGGVILNSASESALTAAVSAREYALREITASELGSSTSGEDVLEIPTEIRAKYSAKMVIYGSTHTHSIGAKAALILDMTFRAVTVSAADKYSLRGDALRLVIEEDVRNGLMPFFIIATVGTTSTGAVDRIDEIGQVVSDYPTISLHIDAAWAGIALALEEQRSFLRLNDINRYANTFCTNMHKWGLVALDASLFFVRDRKGLNRALDITPTYLKSKEADAGAVIDYRNWQLALGRRFRSIKIWFVMRSFGVKGLQNHLRVGIKQCQTLAEIVKRSENFELVTTPSLALLVVCVGKSLPENTLPAERDLLNANLNVRLNARYDVFLSPTMLPATDGNIFCTRIALGGKATTIKDVEEVWDVIEEEGAEVLKEWKGESILVGGFSQ